MHTLRKKKMESKSSLIEFYLNKHLRTYILPRIKNFYLKPTGRIQYDDFKDGDTACKKGYLSLLQSKGDHMYFSLKAMDFAAEGGHLNVLIWLHDNTMIGCTTNAMNSAATKGFLSVVVWLNGNRTEGCTNGAIDGAAKNGHLNVVVWLYENRKEGFTENAFVNAAENGFLDMLQWMSWKKPNMKPEKAIMAAASHGYIHILGWMKKQNYFFTASVMDSAAGGGQIGVMQWLKDEITDITCTAKSLTDASGGGYKDAAVWLCSNMQVEVTRQAINKALTNGHLHVAKYLMEQKEHVLDANIVGSIVENGHLEALQWLDEQIKIDFSQGDLVVKAARMGHDGILRWLHKHKKVPLHANKAIDMAAYGGHLRTLQWLKKNNAVRGTTKALRNAVLKGSLDCVKWLFGEGYKDTNGLMDLAVERNHLDILMWLYENSAMECSENVGMIAEKNGNLEIMKFLFENGLLSDVGGICDRAIINDHMNVFFWLRGKLAKVEQSNAELQNNITNSHPFNRMKKDNKVVYANYFLELFRYIYPSKLPSPYAASVEELNYEIDRALLGVCSSISGNIMIGLGYTNDSLSIQIFGLSFMVKKLLPSGEMTIVVVNLPNNNPPQDDTGLCF